MKKLLIAGLTVLAVVIGSMASAQNRPISDELPWNNDEATVVLQDRLDRMFPDGSAATVLNDALARERITVWTDRRGITTPLGDGNRSASRSVARFRFGCGTRLIISWTQTDGQIFDIEGLLHEGCL